MTYLKTYLTILLFVALGFTTHAQQDSIFILGKDLNSVIFLNEVLESNRIPKSELTTLLNKSFNEGYWLTSIDSLGPEDFAMKCGTKHNFAEIELKIPNSLISSFPNLYNDSLFRIESYAEIKKIKETQINLLENLGYPFAQISLEQMNDTKLKGVIVTGPLVFWDSIIVKGNHNLDPKLIQVGLQLPNSGRYSEDIFNKLRTHKHLNISYIKPPEVLFVKNKAHLFMYIDENSRNSIGGLLGFNGSKGNFNIIGNLDLKLNNKFHRFETIEMHWQTFDNKSQKLNLTLELPHLFKSVFGFTGLLDVFKQDSSFVNYKLGSSLSYYLNNNHKVSTGIRIESSNNLRTEETTISFDVEKKLYLINYAYSRPEGIYRKLKIELAAGNRSTKELKESYSQLLLENSVNFKIYKWLSAYINLEAQKMLADELSINELYRIGGFNSIRGFNELSISAQSYAFINSEIRIKIDANSFVFGFSDFGKIQTLDAINNLLGFGVGILLNSQAGKFAIAYGLGKFDQSPIDFGGSKIHFGYINEF